jgi:hypothetical protein
VLRERHPHSNKTIFFDRVSTIKLTPDFPLNTEKIEFFSNMEKLSRAGEIDLSHIKVRLANA